MSTVVELTEDQITELQKLTNQNDPAEAIRTAVAEYVRYCRRMQLIELSGRIDMPDEWREWEQAELDSDHDRSSAGAD